jgi:hypothetical protein
MRKINVAIVALMLLLAFLSYTSIEVKVAADTITCRSLTGCCGAAGCDGPGRVNGCAIECQGGGAIACCSNASGKCVCGQQ